MNFVLLNAITMEGICVTLGMPAMNFVAADTEFIFLIFHLFNIIYGKVGITNTCPLDLLAVTNINMIF